MNLWKPTLALATLFEAVTVFLRFGLGLEATRDTAATVGRLTFGVRIHHGMVGLALLLVSAAVKGETWKNRLIVLGGALAISDLVHHFAVLWAATGSPQFDLWYPR
ncbi:MAG TPA: hypothetical protein PLU72_01955 [Candidatus Ozemobacteraceae bacterium]|nr:hypothetical protein [Candidatus Ozemobacteraceae bacterium]